MLNGDDSPRGITLGRRPYSGAVVKGQAAHGPSRRDADFTISAGYHHASVAIASAGHHSLGLSVEYSA